jgi:hypothetical protein
MHIVAKRENAKMKGKSALAIAVCVVCFFIGYLSYVAVGIIAAFFIDSISPCQNTVEVCSQQSHPLRKR